MNRRPTKRVEDLIAMRFPFLSINYEHRVRTALKQSGLPVRPIFVTQQPLSCQVQQREKIPCCQPCLCEQTTSCNTKNITYEVTCALCGGTYIGETHRTHRSRLSEHLRPNNGSKVYAHFQTSHHMHPDRSLISCRIRHKGFADTLQRKAFEMQLIIEEKPSINVQFNSHSL